MSIFFITYQKFEEMVMVIFDMEVLPHFPGSAKYGVLFE